MEKQSLRNKPGRKPSPNRKEELSKASLMEFLERGYHPTRIEDIIKKAQVGKGTFYLYFKSKEEVVEYLLDQFIKDIRDTLLWVQNSISQGFERDESLDLRAIFKEEAKRLVKTMLENQLSGKFLFKEGRAVSNNINQKISDFYLEMMQTSETTFALAMQFGFMEKQHPQVAAMIIIGGITQMFNHWLEGDIEDDIETLIEQSVNFFSNALLIEN